MIRWIPKRIFPALTVAILAFALLATAFGNRAPSREDVALEQYVLAGGDLASLCDPSGSGGMTNRSDCLACQIIGAALVPSACFNSVSAVEYAFVAKIVAPRAGRARRIVLDPSNGLRAPPLA